MRVLHCIGYADPRSGGVVEGIRQFAVSFQKKGHHVELASLDPPNAPWLREFPVPAYGLGPGRGSYGYQPAFRKWLEEKSRTVDAVIGNGVWQYTSFAIRQACRRTGTPYFMFVHGMLDPWFKRAYPLKHLKKWLYWYWGEYPVLRDARAVFFTSEEERRLARQSFWIYKANEIVLGYGTNLPPQNVEQQRAAFLQQYPALSSKRIILFMGRIHPKKGCDLLLEAFAQVAPRDSALHLVFAGPDQVAWRSALEQISARLGIAHRVSWLGMVEGDLKWGVMRNAEVFILPSHQENFGVVVAEAMACRVPVLISNRVNIWREIEMDKAGLVEPDDRQGTTRLLTRWLNLSAAEQGQLAANALACFHRHFEMMAASERLAMVLEHEIGSQPPAAEGDARIANRPGLR